METVFKYNFELGELDLFPNDKERLPIPEFEKKGREYFKKIPEQKHTIVDLHNKEKTLMTIETQLINLWWEGEDDPMIAEQYIRRAIEYINSFNYYRFEKKTPDFLPVNTLKVIMGIQRVAYCPNYVNKHQEWVQDAARLILDLLLDDELHTMGIYIYGFEI
ncbi:MAG: hypothetical protein J6Y74_00255 [Clostridia bacterium]|nr:hypothetical protein [Clostridia bacterium]